MTHMIATRPMLFHRIFESNLGSPTKIALAKTLLRSPGRRWTGRELGRASGVSAAQVNRDLKELLATGVVNREVSGRSHVWQLNLKHVLVSQMSRWFSEEESYLRRLLDEIGSHLTGAPIIEARVFGSVVRGDERADSDIDLFIHVRGAAEKEDVETRLETFRHSVWEEFGNALSPIVYTDREVRRPPNPALLESIAQESLLVPLDRSRSGAN
jgi:predicted nucleotidyltransferase